MVNLALQTTGVDGQFCDAPSGSNNDCEKPFGYGKYLKMLFVSLGFGTPEGMTMEAMNRMLHVGGFFDILSHPERSWRQHDKRLSQ